MEVITKERLKELFESHYMENTLTESLEKSIMDECEEIDTLTVSKLRPMSEAEDFEDVLAYKKFGDKNLGFIVYRGDCGLYYCRENAEIVYKDDELIGHVPMVIYKPE